MIKLSEYVFKFVKSLEVKCVFFLAGGGAMHLVDSLGRCPGIQAISMLHEQAVSIAAEAYAMHTGGIGVGLVTTGPGGTNSITGVTAAWVDSTPCLLISGQVKRTDLMTNKGVRQFGPQEVDIVSIVSPITKYAVTVLEPASIRYHLEKALYLALNNRPGPVWLDIPLDVQGATVQEEELLGFTPSELTQCSTNYSIEQPNPVPAYVRTTVEILKRAKRPLVIAGNGIRLAKTEPQFIHLIEALDLPTITTWKAIDMLYNDHPLYVGRCGILGERSANFAVQNADFILCLGTRLDVSLTGFNREDFAPRAKKIVVDIDMSELHKFGVDFDLLACCNVRDFITELFVQGERLALAKQAEYDRANWKTTIGAWRRKYPVVLADYHKTGAEGDGRINPYLLIDALSEAMSSDEVIVPCSAGTAAEITFQALRVKAGQKIRSNHGLGSMGFDLPASIGACLANGRKRTVCVTGDGGMQLNIQELETVKRLNLPIKVFVMNNDGYASIRGTQRNLFQGNYVGSDRCNGQSFPDCLRIADAYGIKGFRVGSAEDLVKTIRLALDTPGPVICDVLTLRDFIAQPKVTSVRTEDGSMRSNSLENMWPFLSSEEIKSNSLWG